MDPDHLSSYWGDVLDGLGLPHVRFHDIRHTFATRAIEQGIDVATVAGLLGHADVTDHALLRSSARCFDAKSNGGCRTGRSSYTRMAEYPIICTEKR